MEQGPRTLRSSFILLIYLIIVGAAGLVLADPWWGPRGCLELGERSGVDRSRAGRG